jgi:hypothetical protein
VVCESLHWTETGTYTGKDGSDVPTSEAECLLRQQCLCMLDFGARGQFSVDEWEGIDSEEAHFARIRSFVEHSCEPLSWWGRVQELYVAVGRIAKHSAICIAESRVKCFPGLCSLSIYQR